MKTNKILEFKKCKINDLNNKVVCIKNEKPIIKACTKCEGIVITNMRHHEVPITFLTCDGFHGVDYHDNYSNPGTPSSVCYSTSYSSPNTPIIYNENLSNVQYGNINSNNLYNLNDSNDSNDSNYSNNLNNSNDQNDFNNKTDNTFSFVKYKKSPNDAIIKDCDICKGIVVVNYKHSNIPNLFICNDLHENEFHGYDFHK